MAGVPRLQEQIAALRASVPEGPSQMHDQIAR